MRQHNIDSQTSVKLDDEGNAKWRGDLETALVKARELIDFLERWVGAAEEHRQQRRSAEIQDLIRTLDQQQKRRLLKLRTLVVELQEDNQSALEIVAQIRVWHNGPRTQQLLDILARELSS